VIFSRYNFDVKSSNTSTACKILSYPVLAKLKLTRGRARKEVRLNLDWQSVSNINASTDVSVIFHSCPHNGTGRFFDTYNKLNKLFQTLNREIIHFKESSTSPITLSFHLIRILQSFSYSKAAFTTSVLRFFHWEMLMVGNGITLNGSSWGRNDKVTGDFL
jgi:uncharacterized protein (DUF983 family)